MRRASPGFQGARREVDARTATLERYTSSISTAHRLAKQSDSHRLGTGAKRLECADEPVTAAETARAVAPRAAIGRDTGPLAFPSVTQLGGQRCSGRGAGSDRAEMLAWCGCASSAAVGSLGTGAAQPISQDGATL